MGNTIARNFVTNGQVTNLVKCQIGYIELKGTALMFFDTGKIEPSRRWFKGRK